MAALTRFRRNGLNTVAAIPALQRVLFLTRIKRLSALDNVPKQFESKMFFSPFYLSPVRSIKRRISLSTESHSFSSFSLLITASNGN